MRRIVTGANIAAALLAAALALPVHREAQAAGPQLLRYHWVVGQRFGYARTDTSIATDHYPTASAVKSTSKEVDKYSERSTVTKVYPDGSGLVHTVFSHVSVTKNGKTRTYDLSHYALDVRKSTLGAVLSTRSSGSLPPGLVDSNESEEFSNPTPTRYPAGTVSVGGTWPVADTSEGETSSYRFRLLATGSANGRPTLTISVGHVSVRGTEGGLQLTGTGTWSGSETLYVDTGALAAPYHMVMSVKIAVKGTVEGVVVDGVTSDSDVDEAVPLR